MAGRPKGATGGGTGGDTAKHWKNWDLQRSYHYDTHDANGNVTSSMTEDEWRALIREQWSPDALKANHVTIMFHDHDVQDDGLPKGLHAHAVVNVKDARTTQSAMMKRSGVSRADNCQGTKNKKGSYRYLFHITKAALDAGKYVYDLSSAEVYRADGVEFDLRAALAGKTKEDLEDAEGMAAKREELTRDVMLGVKTAREVKSYYLEDPDSLGFSPVLWGRHRGVYAADELDWLNDRAWFFESHDRCLVTGYIEAPGGCGKTRVAKYIANRYNEERGSARGVHFVGTQGQGKTFDLAGQYKGQLVSVLNELKGTSFDADEFCSLFDPIAAPIANSRNTDKPWFPDLALITTGREFESFLWDMYVPYAAEKIKPDGEAPKSADGWRRLYTSVPDVADKLRQIRRRFVWRIQIYVVNGQRMVAIQVRDDAVNPSCPLSSTDYRRTPIPQYMPLGTEDANTVYGSGCWATHSYVAYNDDSDLEKVYAQVKLAIRAYYELNPAYTITPWSVGNWVEDGGEANV